MSYYQAESVSEIKVQVGEVFKLESLRRPVIPRFINLIPFIVPPNGLRVVKQIRPDEEGVSYLVYEIKCEAPLDDKIVIGLKDMSTDDIQEQKEIAVTTA